jgi:transcription elongation factor Elf1
VFKEYVEPKTLLCPKCFKAAVISQNALDESNKTMIISCACGQFEISTRDVLVPVRLDVKKRRILVSGQGGVHA